MKELVSYVPQNSVQDADPPFLDQFFSINSCSLWGLHYAEIGSAKSIEENYCKVIFHCVVLVEHHSLHPQSGNRRKRKVTVFVFYILSVSFFLLLDEEIICLYDLQNLP